MIDAFSFAYVDFLWPVGIGALLLFALFLWKEWSLPRRKYYLHVFIALVTIIALVLLILRPMILDVQSGGRGILLTEGYHKEQLDSLRNIYKGIKQIPYVENAPMADILDSISSVFIVGNGVRTFDFWQLNGIPTTYLETEEPEGIVQLKYNNETSVGDHWVVHGSYNAHREKCKLILADPGGNPLDSVLIDTIGSTRFKLSTDLNVSGRYLYQLLEKDSSGTTIANEPLPVLVKPKKELRFLMIQGFPTFDSKYLKNFLAESGNALVVRNQLSRGKYKFEYFNTERLPFYSLSNKLLASTDVLLIDSSSFVNLSRSSIGMIESAMQYDGLGVFILPDDSFFKVPVNTSNFEFSREATSKTTLEEWPDLPFEKYPFAFENAIGLEEIHRSNTKIVTAYKRRGRGRIGTTVVRNSYQLVLKGNRNTYRQFWSEMITAIAKRDEPTLEWEPIEWLTYGDEPFTFVVRTLKENPQVFGANGRIALAQHIDIKGRYSGTTYPRASGWSTLSSRSDSLSRLDFYVMDNSQWKSLRNFRTRMQNKRQFSETEVSANDKRVLRPIHPIWFFLTSIVGMGYLWLAPKLMKN